MAEASVTLSEFSSYIEKVSFIRKVLAESFRMGKFDAANLAMTSINAQIKDTYDGPTPDTIVVPGKKGLATVEEQDGEGDPDFGMLADTPPPLGILTSDDVDSELPPSSLRRYGVEDVFGVNDDEDEDDMLLDTHLRALIQGSTGL